MNGIEDTGINTEKQYGDIFNLHIQIISSQHINRSM